MVCLAEVDHRSVRTSVSVRVSIQKSANAPWMAKRITNVVVRSVENMSLYNVRVRERVDGGGRAREGDGDDGGRRRKLRRDGEAKRMKINRIAQAALDTRSSKPADNRAAFSGSFQGSPSAPAVMRTSNL